MPLILLLVVLALVLGAVGVIAEGLQLLVVIGIVLLGVSMLLGFSHGRSV